MDKGNNGFLNDADAEWERKAEEATRREEWVTNRYEELNERSTNDMWGDIHDVLGDAAYDYALIEKLTKYYKVGDWTGIGNLIAGKIVERLYKIAEEEYGDN